MPTDWKAAYAAALAERDPKKLPKLCDKACRAINAKLLKTGSAANRSEREELEEALRLVTLHLLLPKAHTKQSRPAKRMPNAAIKKGIHAVGRARVD
ncbi:MAG: hypothetical protein WBV36_11910 [Terriglobales bacterium]